LSHMGGAVDCLEKRFGKWLGRSGREVSGDSILDQLAEATDSRGNHRSPAGKRLETDARHRLSLGRECDGVRRVEDERDPRILEGPEKPNLGSPSLSTLNETTQWTVSCDEQLID